MCSAALLCRPVPSDSLPPTPQPANQLLEINEYAEKKPAKVREYVNTIRYVPDWSYIFIADFDQRPCVTRRKDQILSRYGNLDAGRILIVRAEIESWYLAGLDSDSCEELQVPERRNTDGITKEQFDSLMPSRFENRTDFMVEILNRYDIGTALGKNASFGYAMGKHFSPSR